MMEQVVFLMDFIDVKLYEYSFAMLCYLIKSKSKRWRVRGWGGGSVCFWDWEFRYKVFFSKSVKMRNKWKLDDEIVQVFT